jgi:hypothetical protein
MTCAFLHIPKSGGTSLIHLLVGRYGPSVLEADDALELFDLHRYLSRYDCIVGHIPAAAFATQFPDCRVFTILRDPLGRARSAMSHFISEQHHPFHWLIESGAVPFEALFGERPFSSELSNIQCRLLGFDVDAETRLQMQQQSGDAWRRFGGAFSERPVDDDQLERAIALLQRIPFGIFEYFDYSCTQILREFLSEHPPAHLRAPKRRFEPTAGQIEIMAAANAFDRKLYDAALPLFLERAAEHNISLGELIGLRGAPQPFEGLDVPELYRDGLLRWTTGAAHLRLAVPRSAAMVRVSLWNLDGLLERRQQLHVTVDGRDMTPVVKDAVQYDYEAHLPADRMRNFVSVRVDSETTSYPDHGRILGVPLRSVAIRRMT